ncbi:MAG: cation-translocating P-type ATPase, partial [Planctomycetota bacterium]
MPEHMPIHAQDAEQVLQELGVDREQGLDAETVEQRRSEYGPNELQEAETRSWLWILLDQFRSMVVYLLSGAAVLAFATGHLVEGIAIAAVIVVNTAIGFVSEWKAVRSMAALRRLGQQRARARRNGGETGLPAAELVPGDIVLLQAGEVVPADVRLLSAERLRVDQAALTGESVPATKTVQKVEPDTELADRKNMLYKGTSVANGEAVGVVVAIGTGTELGRIARLAEEAESGVPPLQQRLDRLGRRLGWLTIAIAAALALLGILVRGQEVALVVETALALGVAAIPEGLPIVATIGLARGMYLMAKRNALVNRLTAVETLGATGTILSDKTGTLTENRMRAWRLITADGDHQLGGDEPEQELTDQASRALRVGVLCSEAQLSDDGDEQSGDPTEIALLTGGRDHGLQRPELLQQWEQLRLEPFSSESKQMATFHKDQDRVLVAVKGAPEVLLGNCTRVLTESDEDEELTDSSRERWSERAEALAKDGLRVLGLADKHVESPDAEPYEELTLLGFIGLMDPPRAGVREAIHACQAAGIRVGMVTGDQPLTARAIAESVGMAGGEGGPEAVVMRGRDLVPPDQMDADLRERVLRSNIFARVAPEQKLHLVSICQDAGQVVAVTGDGVNDAPALKKADIGIAMGKRGTEAAKQVADMVLKDDAFSTIVAAVEQGRVIF